MRNEEHGRATVIALGNQKGGVGKTTNTVHIAAALGELGRKCLIFDLDMNAGSTKHFGIKGEGFLGTFEVLTGVEAAEGVILRDGEEDVHLPPNVDLIASCRKLESIDKAIAARNKFTSSRDILSRPLAPIRDLYDYIFLDTAPNATSPTVAAYLAADWFILTAMPEPLAIDGLSEALTDINDAQTHGNPNLRLLGLVLCAIDNRTTLSNDLEQYVHEAFSTPGRPSAKFSTTISRSTVVGTAQEKCATLFQTSRRHKVTDQYRSLALEVEERLRSSRAEDSASLGQEVAAAGVVERASNG